MSTTLTTAATPVQHQSFWDKIKSVEHNFLAFWAQAYTKFQKDEPTIEAGLDAVAKYAVPALNIALAAAGGPAGIGVEAAAAIAEAQTGITVASSLVHDFGPTPDAASVLNGVQNNLSGIEALTNVKNPTTVSAIQKVVTLVSATASGLAAAASAAKTTSSTTAASSTVNGSGAATAEPVAEEVAAE
jgi:hypothetical protein